MKPPSKRSRRGPSYHGSGSITAPSDKNSAHASSSSSSSSKTAANYQCPEGDMALPDASAAAQDGVGPEEDGPAIDGDMAASVAALESLLGYPFRDPRLAEEALTHPSAQRDVSYQRLEFVGDAALGLAVALHLYLTNPGEGPGRLSLLRSANVSTEKLARVALRHGLYGHLRRSAPPLDTLVADFAAAVAREEDDDAELAAIYGGASVRAPKVLADVVESVAAAVFVDSGFDLAAMWQVCRALLEPIITAETFHDQPVSVLTKLCQQRGWALDFKSWRKGDHAVANAFVNGQLLGIGSSDQKHIAKLNAARDALREISRLISEAEASEMQTEEEELGVGSGGAVTTGGEEMDGSEDTGMDTVVGGREEVKDAKGTEEGTGEVCGKNDAVVIGSGWPEEEVEGAKMRLNAICGKNHWPNPVYRIDRELGPAHDKRFICSVRVETPEGVYAVSGHIKSKRKDAENAAASKLIKGLLNGLATKLNS